MTRLWWVVAVVVGCGSPPSDSSDSGVGDGAAPAECGNGVEEPGEQCDQATVANGVCAVDCTLLCDTGFGDCNELGADGCEADLASAANCVECGRVCDSCTAGECVLDQRFAEEQEYPYALAIGASKVFWTNNGLRDALDNQLLGAVMARPIAGGSIEVVAADRSLPRDIAVDGSHVYWIEQSGPTELWRTPNDGTGSAEMLSTGLSDSARIALLDDRVLIADETRLKSIAKDGSDPDDHGSFGGRIYSIAVHQSTAYFAAGQWGDTLYQFSFGGTASALASDLGSEEVLLALAADDTHVFFVVSKPGGGEAFAKSIERGSGNVLNLLLETGSPFIGLDISADDVFVAVADGATRALFRAPKAPGEAEVVSGAPGDVRDIRVDGDLVYWASGGDRDAATGYIGRERF